MIAAFLLSTISAYRRIVSPLTMPRCRFAPSCSEYAATAITRYGAGRGGLLAIRRLLRCHPLCAGGWDPVPDTTDRTLARGARHRGVHP